MDPGNKKMTKPRMSALRRLHLSISWKLLALHQRLHVFIYILSHTNDPSKRTTNTDEKNTKATKRVSKLDVVKKQGNEAVEIDIGSVPP